MYNTAAIRGGRLAQLRDSSTKDLERFRVACSAQGFGD